MSVYGPGAFTKPLQSIPFTCAICNTPTDFTQAEHVFQCSARPCVGQFHFRCMCERFVGHGKNTCPTCENPLRESEITEILNSDSGDIQQLKNDVQTLKSDVHNLKNDLQTILNIVRGIQAHLSANHMQ
jgi:hypothetical protein